MCAFNNYCTVCDKLIPNDSPSSKLTRTNSNVSIKLYCSSDCERKDNLHLINSTVTTSNDSITDVDNNVLEVPSLRDTTNTDKIRNFLASPVSLSISPHNAEEFPSITITTVTDDVTSKATLEESEQLLASPFLLPINSNSDDKTNLFDMNNDDHIDNENLILGENSIPYYVSLPPLNSFYNIPKQIFSNDSKTNFCGNNLSADKTAEQNYKLWLSHNLP